MMSGVPLETCWAFNKLWNNKFYYKAASCWCFYRIIHNARIHEYQIYVYCTLTEVFLNLTEIFLTLTEVFPCFFLNCKANARVKLAKTGHGPHSSTLVVICVVRLLLVLFYVLLVCKCVLAPGDNPIAVNKYIISHTFSMGIHTHFVLHTSKVCYRSILRARGH